LGGRPGRADHARRRSPLRRVYRRAALHDRAEPLVRKRAGLRVFLDRAADGARCRVRARRHSRPFRAAAAMTIKTRAVETPAIETAAIETPAAANRLALETRGLCKSFGALTVADQINFRLERGPRQALIGPNGAGKTTFVELVTG